MKTFTLVSKGTCPMVLVAVLALTNNYAADDGIIYHKGPIVLNETSPGTDIDLDGDGNPDFRFSVGVLSGLPGPGASPVSTPYLDTFAFNRNNYLLNAEGRIVLKSEGFKFEPKPEAGERWGHRDSESQAIAYNSGNKWSGFNGKPPEAYLGVCFTSKGVVHYGWIRFVVLETNPPTIFPVIADWAYESRPNTVIRAGEKPGKTK